MIAVVVILAAAVADPGVLAQPSPRLTVSVAAGQHTVGDRVPVDLTVTAPEPLAGAPRFPAWGESWGDAEVVEAGAVETVEAEGGGTAYRQRVVLTAFRPGAVALPPREIAVPLAAGTRLLSTPADLALEITSVLPPPPEGEERPIPPPRPPEAPRALPVPAAFFWTAGILLALILAILWLARRRAAAAAATAPAPPLPPLPELERSLAAARAAGSPREGHALVSHALRRFLGRALRFPAAESTTTEVGRQLHGRHLPGGLANRAVELLRACDLVKFARHPAGAAAVERWCDEATRIGHEVDDYLRPAEPAPDAPEAGREKAA
ncbi:MAG TPA: hypothetical protein VHQ65_01845 [Thermoanaerobaculia bacterium]|nr:hypothetical protein [Thermoanaerobaculia bacterium]